MLTLSYHHVNSIFIHYRREILVGNEHYLDVTASSSFLALTTGFTLR
jgi:hypothetical protein